MPLHLQIKSYSPELYTEEHIVYSKNSWIIHDLFAYTEVRTQTYAHPAGFTAAATMVGSLRISIPVATIVLVSACVHGIYLCTTIYRGQYVYTRTGRS